MVRTPKIYSFDVFDTCIARRFAHPRDLFYELGLQLSASYLGANSAGKFAREFQRQRIRAERRAYRAVRPYECATIREIYEHFSAPAGLQLDVDSLIGAEVQLERESIFPVPGIVSQIENLRAAGHRIVFISDMYLPASVLGPILQSLGVMRKDETLYVSCDARVTKHTGNLYKHVLTCEGAHPEQVIHTGDNEWADIRQARNAGIDARHYSSTALTAHEKAQAGRRLPRSAGGSFLSALSRRTRLLLEEDAPDDVHPLNGIVQTVIAPFLVSYVDWVLNQSMRSGIQRLYFVARDGEILYRIAKILSNCRASPELQYIHGSRRAWLTPSLEPGSSTWHRLVLLPNQANSPRDMLSRAGLEAEALAKIQARLSIPSDQWSRALNSDGAHEFLARLLQSPSAAALLEQAAATRRLATTAYFRQQGMLDGSKWALVDAGWSLNSQAALARILRTAGFEGLPHGYYIALTRARVSAREAGTADAFAAPPGNLISRRAIVIEHCFTPSTHATTREYGFDGTRAVPVFGEELRDSNELAYAARVQRVALGMARTLDGDPRLALELRRHRRDVIGNVECLLRRPSLADAKAMATFRPIADVRHDKAFSQPLCKPLRVSDLWTVAGMTLWPRRNVATPSFMWLEGSSVMSPVHIRMLVALMLFLDDLRSRFRSRR